MALACHGCHGAALGQGEEDDKEAGLGRLGPRLWATGKEGKPFIFFYFFLSVLYLFCFVYITKHFIKISH